MPSLPEEMWKGFVDTFDIDLLQGRLTLQLSK